MYNCEIYSVLKSDVDTASFNENIDDIAASLYERNIRVMYNTEIKPVSKEFTKSLEKSSAAELGPDYNIFVNALDTTDASSFKSLFHNFIKNEQNKIVPDDEHEGMVPKVRICKLGDLGNGYLGFCFEIFDIRYVVLPLASLTGKNIAELVNEAIDKAQEIFKRNSDATPFGITYVEKKEVPQSTHKKESFLMSFIPHKGDSKNAKARKTVVLFAMIAFFVAAGYLVNEFVIKPYLNEQVTSEIHDIAYDSVEDSDDDIEGSAQNWKKLKKLNKEIVGWVTIDKTKIDYPVLEHKGDNAYSQYYLNRTYKKTYSDYGSVFVDYRCTDSVKSKNVILHGHNIRDGSMFHGLLDYSKGLEGNLEFYKKHPVIEFNTPEGDAKYKIISVFKTSTLYAHGEFFNYMQGEFLSDAEFMNFVYNVRIRSLIDCPVMTNEDDQLLTLSTCSYEYSNFRTVVVARKVRDGEKEDVDVEIATLNKDPLFPDVYYTNHAGERPKDITFKKANKKGLVSWYDGEGELEGSEVLTATVEANPTEEPTSKKDKNKKTETEAIVNYYQVKFVNWDGSEYYTVSVAEGNSVEIPGGTPGLPSDDYFDYKFTGWQTSGLDLDSVHYSMTIYPDFTATEKN